MAKRLANPAPLGLFGFALTTALLQGGVTGITGVQAQHPVSAACPPASRLPVMLSRPTLAQLPASSAEGSTTFLVYGYAFAFGGAAQALAGIFELVRGTTLPAVAFVCYGAFWIGFAINGICGVTGAYPSLPHDGEKMFLALWGFITFFFFAASLCVNFVLQALFLLLSIVFWLLAGGVANSHSHKAAGWIGLVVAGIAFYGGVAEMLNEIYDKTVLPLWPCSPGASFLPHVQRTVGSIPFLGPAYMRAIEREDELAGRGGSLHHPAQPSLPTAVDKSNSQLSGGLQLTAAVPV